MRNADDFDLGHCYLAARQLLDRYGDHAEFYVLDRIDGLWELQDVMLADRWNQVCHAIAEFNGESRSLH